jgi:hypothetical protein
MTDHDDEEPGPGGMDAVPDEPLETSEEPGGMSGIPDPDPPSHEEHDED